MEIPKTLMLIYIIWISTLTVDGARTCPPIYSTATMSVKCSFEGEQTENCTNPVDGTIAMFKCAPSYEDLQLSRNPAHICRDGVWDGKNPNCVLKCGKNFASGQSLILEGKEDYPEDYPWQVAIYNVEHKLLICSGSLINQRVIVTAAHCVADSNGKALSKDLYVVAVGKNYRKYDDFRDNAAQFSPLKEIFIPKHYKGQILNYNGDIAVLVAEKTFRFSPRVQPVCVDWGLNYQNTTGLIGYVTGWGISYQNNNASNLLKEVKVSLATNQQCRQNLPPDFEVYFTADKLCGENLDNSTSLCRGDGGGGLVFKRDGRYYLTGIVSISPRPPTEIDSCTGHQYTLYTNVYKYIDNILKTESN